MDLLTFLFLDSNGKFQWASIAAFISLGVAIAAYLNNKKILNQQRELNEENFKGNIVAKARIDWIQEVRKKSVDFISSCHKLLAYMKNTEISDDKVIDGLKADIENNATLLILYFGPDKGKNKNNDFIIYLISLLSEKIINKENYYDKEHILELDDSIDVLRDFLRIYFKAEWKRANREIPAERVQSYLESHKYYRKIMKIYAYGFACHEEGVECFYSQLERKANQD
ncbi:hypothetical protein M4I33_13175 [Clostridium sp. LY3-2]|uniref:hypothetical protein n=1 Tax=Clostridium sp. LY3-2 TaxID=2942482 RepID=UPI00215208EB|nr:hypothetical protein [Clostridium sp. LY3-2]MCR6515822.1 hypothetical protein [Clostridium sp. LY3-2]